MHLTYQIPGLPKVLYLKNELRHEIEFVYMSNKTVRLDVI